MRLSVGKFLCCLGRGSIVVSLYLGLFGCFLVLIACQIIHSLMFCFCPKDQVGLEWAEHRREGGVMRWTVDEVSDVVTSSGASLVTREGRICEGKLVGARDSDGTCSVKDEILRARKRTPSKQKIKEITSELSQHGHISETNVYNWFQNRRARSKRKQQIHATNSGESEVDTEVESPKLQQNLTSASDGVCLQNMNVGSVDQWGKKVEPVYPSDAGLTDPRSNCSHHLIRLQRYAISCTPFFLPHLKTLILTNKIRAHCIQTV
ncbi:hypothetical protein QVD17_05062 [Tagetes erecta]|uniref:Homeobox domain-containing protein n=1 Tax=Tagetes erecta TaxID=13708 RepID=A0AAD8PB79_TARER|nr:hypothetical protein QVD17_05062 [Tagetes erecta]